MPPVTGKDFQGNSRYIKPIEYSGAQVDEAMKATADLLAKEGAVSYISVALPTMNVQMPGTNFTYPEDVKNSTGLTADIIKGVLATNPASKINFMCPINLGGGHWVGMCVQVDKDSGQAKIVYTDSLESKGDPSFEGKKIKAELTRVTELLAGAGFAGKVLVEEHKHTWRQEDKISCGTYTVENLRRIAEDKGSEITPDHMTLRAKQLSLFQNPTHIRGASLSKELIDKAYILQNKTTDELVVILSNGPELRVLIMQEFNITNLNNDLDNAHQRLNALYEDYDELQKTSTMTQTADEKLLASTLSKLTDFKFRTTPHSKTSDEAQIMLATINSMVESGQWISNTEKVQELSEALAKAEPMLKLEKQKPITQPNRSRSQSPSNTPSSRASSVTSAQSKASSFGSARSHAPTSTPPTSPRKGRHSH